mmetsp:Transcript_54937/g.120187  ORF Transcript_54937/g.120187 Transcript_54937/m.120187 type:complete len:204 (+) Transcript_54937:71-682(+)
MDLAPCQIWLIGYIVGATVRVPSRSKRSGLQWPKSHRFSGSRGSTSRRRCATTWQPPVWWMPQRAAVCLGRSPFGWWKWASFKAICRNMFGSEAPHYQEPLRCIWSTTGARLKCPCHNVARPILTPAELAPTWRGRATTRRCCSCGNTSDATAHVASKCPIGDPGPALWRSKLLSVALTSSYTAVPAWRLPGAFPMAAWIWST